MALIVTALLGPAAILNYSDYLQALQNRQKLKIDAYQGFNRASIDVLNRLTDLYHLTTRDHVEFDRTRRQAASQMNALIWMGNELYLAFDDESLFSDIQHLKLTLQELNALARQRPVKASLTKIETLQDRALKQIKLIQLKMVCEMGRMSPAEFQKGMERLRLTLGADAQTARCGKGGARVTDVSSWLNANSNLVLSVAAVITAIATVFIARANYVSSQLLQWEREKDRRGRQPILVLSEEIVGAGAQQQSRDLYIENVGYGPAINVVRTVLATAGLTANIVTNQPLLIRPLGQGQRAYSFCGTLPPNAAAPLLDEAGFRMRVEYDDVYENHYETVYENRRLATRQILKRGTPAENAAHV